VAESLGTDSTLEDITPILEEAGCYRRRDHAIRMVCPGYGPGYKSKIVLPSVIDSDSFRLFSVVVMAPNGTQTKHRLTRESYLGIVAATNFKQRVRKMPEYYHADRLNYVVAGTPNRLEYDQGFFVKLGAGAADVISTRSARRHSTCTSARNWSTTSRRSKLTATFRGARHKIGIPNVC
jgi:NAD+ synthase